MATPSSRANRHSIVRSMGLGDRREPPEPVASPPTFQHQPSHSLARDYPDVKISARSRKDSNSSRKTSASQRTARRQASMGQSGAAGPHAVQLERASSTATSTRAKERASLQIDTIGTVSPPLVSPAAVSSATRVDLNGKGSANLHGGDVASPASVTPPPLSPDIARNSSARRRPLQVDRDGKDDSIRRRSTQVDRTSMRQSFQMDRTSLSQGSVDPPPSDAPFHRSEPLEQSTPQQVEKNAGGWFFSRLFAKGNGQEAAPKSSSQVSATARFPSNDSKLDLQPTATSAQICESSSTKTKKTAPLIVGKTNEESDEAAEYESIDEPSPIASDPEAVLHKASPEFPTEQSNNDTPKRLSTIVARTKQKSDRPNFVSPVDALANGPTKKKKNISMFRFSRKNRDGSDDNHVDDGRRRRYNAAPNRKASSGSVISSGALTDLAFVDDDSRSTISTKPLGLGALPIPGLRAHRYQTIDEDDTIQEADEEEDDVPSVSRDVSRERPRRKIKSRGSLSRERPQTPADPTSSRKNGAQSDKEIADGGWTDDEEEFVEASGDNFTIAEAPAVASEPADVHDDDTITSVLRRGENIATLGPHLSATEAGTDQDEPTELADRTDDSHHQTASQNETAGNVLDAVHVHPMKRNISRSATGQDSAARVEEMPALKTAADPKKLQKKKKQKQKNIGIGNTKAPSASQRLQNSAKKSSLNVDEDLPAYDEKLKKHAPAMHLDEKDEKVEAKTTLAGTSGVLGGGFLSSILASSPIGQDPEEPSNRNRSHSHDEDKPTALDLDNYDDTYWSSDDASYFSDRSISENAVVAAPQKIRKTALPSGPVSADHSDDDHLFDDANRGVPQDASHLTSKRKPVPAAVVTSDLVEGTFKAEKRQQRPSMLPYTAIGGASKIVTEREKGALPQVDDEDHSTRQIVDFKGTSKGASGLQDGPPSFDQSYGHPANGQDEVAPPEDKIFRQDALRGDAQRQSQKALVGGVALNRIKSPPAPEKPQKSKARALAKQQAITNDSMAKRAGSLHRKKATSATLARSRLDSDLHKSNDGAKDKLGHFANRDSDAQGPVRKPSKRTKNVGRTLTPEQRHYLLKALVCLQMQSEWEELEKLGALTQYGFPFSSDRPELTRMKLDLQNEYTSGDSMADENLAADPYADKDRDEARRLESLQEPYILRHLFHTHLTTFPGLKEAPIKWWQRRIQVFFDEMAARNFSTSLERSEYSRRRFFSLAATRYLGVYFARGIGVRGPSELRGPGPGEPGSERWGVGKKWGKGTVKRGLDQPARIDPALWKKIDNLFGEGAEGDVWRQAGEESLRIRRDWQAWKEQIIENEEGLDETVDFLDVSKIRNLPPKYRNAEEWARNHAAYLLHSLFVSSPQADSVFSVLKGIHTLFPYWGAKQLLKYANAQVLIEGILNLLLARPAGAKSLIQRIAAYVIGSEATTIQKEYIVPLKKELADKELTDRIEEYVARGSRAERRSLKSRADKTGDDIMTVILLSSAGMPLSREAQGQVIKMQHAFARSPYRGNVDLAYPASTGFAKTNPDRSTSVPRWDATRSEAEAARKYAQLKLYLRACLKKRDREEAVRMASGSLLPTIIKETLSIVFYDGIKEIAKVADLSSRLGDLQAFIDDLIDVKKKKDDSIQAWIALAARHENSLYYVVHECVSIAGPLFQWCQIGLDFMALSTSDPVHPADRRAKNIEVNLEEMLQDRRLTDRDVDLIMEEVDELTVYSKWTKVAYELQLRQNYLLARPDAATASQLTEDDIPTEQMKEEIRDVDTLMRELMEEEGVPIDDGTLPNESRGTEARDQAMFWFDVIDPLGQHLRAERESEELRYEPLSVTPPIPCLKYIRKLLPVFADVLRERLPDWENGDVNGPAKVRSPREAD